MKQLITVISMIILLGCSKEEKDSKITVCPEPETWLSVKIKEYTPCTCLTEIRKGTLNGQVVVWIGSVDPLCNGIDMVYKADGTILTTSADAGGFKAVMDKVTDFTAIWSCSKGKG